MENSKLKNTNDNSREYNLDLLKALAIICMVFCHPMLRLGQYNEGYENSFLYFLCETILGDYVVAAHGFMLAMGFGIVYTKNNAPKKIIQRGIKIYFLGYLLNFLRYGIYILGYDLINAKIDDKTFDALFFQDIFQFAGLALIVTGFLKAIKLKEIHIFSIALLISILTTFIPNLDTKNIVFNTFLGSFFYTTKDETVFPFFYWYIFVATGIVFGTCLSRIKDKQLFYKNVFKISLPIMLVYIVLSLRYGEFFLSSNNNYYTLSTLEALGLLSIDFFLLSLFYFMLKKFNDLKFRMFINMSKNLTKIYIIHWCILGFVESIFCYLMELRFSYLQICIFSFVLLFVSSFLATKIKFKV